MEVQYALSEQKEILTIFLEDTKLPPGLSLCLQQFQSISVSEKNWMESACKALLQRQDAVETDRSAKSTRTELPDEDEIDHALELWSFWKKAQNAQNKRFERRGNPPPTPSQPLHESISEDVPPKLNAVSIQEPQPVSPSQESDKTRYPFAVNVSITPSEGEDVSDFREEHTNDYAGIFRWIPPGKITILVPYSDERRLVHVRDGFWLGEYVVTQSVYTKIMGSNPSFTDLGLGENSENYPVNNISWLDAVSFCRALTMLAQNEGQLPAKHEYRLPTEVSGNMPVEPALRQIFTLGMTQRFYTTMAGFVEIVAKKCTRLV